MKTSHELNGPYPFQKSSKACFQVLASVLHRLKQSIRSSHLCFLVSSDQFYALMCFLVSLAFFFILSVTVFISYVLQFHWIFVQNLIRSSLVHHYQLRIQHVIFNLLLIKSICVILHSPQYHKNLYIYICSKGIRKQDILSASTCLSNLLLQDFYMSLSSLFLQECHRN